MSISQRAWEESLQCERLKRAKEIHSGYVAAQDRGVVMDDRAETIMETLGWILLDNDQEPETFEDDNDD